MKAKHFIEHNGKNLTIRQWEYETGIHRSTLHTRIVILKWPVERALTEPVKIKRQPVSIKKTIHRRSPVYHDPIGSKPTEDSPAERARKLLSTPSGRQVITEAVRLIVISLNQINTGVVK